MSVSATQPSPLRVLLGILGGALFGAVAAAAFLGVLVAMPLIIGDVHPIERENHLRHLRFTLAFANVVGAIIGTLAGLASHVPKSGVSFLRCCLLISVPAGLVRLMTAPRPKVSEVDQFYFSYAASFSIAILATGILIWFGVSRGREGPADVRQ